jgi:hypothetical protein
MVDILTMAFRECRDVAELLFSTAASYVESVRSEANVTFFGRVLSSIGVNPMVYRLRPPFQLLL